MSGTAEELTAERGKHYGPPEHHFSCTQAMFLRWCARRSQAQPIANTKHELAFRHAVYMILDKITRAGEDPMHVDNWDDIAGYALCAKRVLGLAK